MSAPASTVMPGGTPRKLDRENLDALVDIPLTDGRWIELPGREAIAVFNTIVGVALTRFKVGESVLVGENNVRGIVVAVNPNETHHVKVRPIDGPGLAVWELVENVRRA